jgi:hypothetical protein
LNTSEVQLQEVDVTPLGETLQRARQAKGVTIEDAERVTRIPRKYIEALEVENYGILPAPVYARGFLRSYAGYLGLDAKELLPLFPIGHVEEPKLEPLPEVRQPRTWNMNGVIAMFVVAALIAIVIGLYSVGRGDSSSSFGGTFGQTGDNGDVITGDEGPGAGGGVANAIPELAGSTLEEATAIIEESGATYFVVRVTEGDIPTGQVIGQSIEPGTIIGPGDVVTLTVAE